MCNGNVELRVRVSIRFPKLCVGFPLCVLFPGPILTKRLLGGNLADGRFVYAKLHFALQIALRRLRGASRDPESGLVALRGAFS